MAHSTGLAAGIDIDAFAPRLSFFWGIGMNFYMVQQDHRITSFMTRLPGVYSYRGKGRDLWYLQSLYSLNAQISLILKSLLGADPLVGLY